MPSVLWWGHWSASLIFTSKAKRIRKAQTRLQKLDDVRYQVMDGLSNEMTTLINLSAKKSRTRH